MIIVKTRGNCFRVQVTILIPLAQNIMETFHEVFQFLAVRDLAMLDSAATNKVLRSFLHEQATAVRKLALINTMDPVGVSAIRCCIKFGVRLTGVVNYHGTVNSVSCAALCKGCDTSK